MFKRTLHLMFLLLLSLHGLAQEQTVTGTVKDTTGTLCRVLRSLTKT